MADPYRYFRIEAAEILEQLQTGLLDLEKGASSAEVIAKLLRLAHTLKGAARVVKQKSIADHCHAVEDLLVPIRDAGAAAAPSVIEGALQRVDAMRAELAALSAPVPAPFQPSGSAQTPTLDDAFWAAKPNVDDLDVLMDGIAELNVQLGGVRGSRRDLERAAGACRIGARPTDDAARFSIGRSRPGKDAITGRRAASAAGRGRAPDLRQRGTGLA